LIVIAIGRNPGVFARLRSFAYNILRFNQSHTIVQDRPLVIERERINFEYEPGLPKTEPDARAGRDQSESRACPPTAP